MTDTIPTCDTNPRGPTPGAGSEREKARAEVQLILMDPTHAYHKPTSYPGAREARQRMQELYFIAYGEE